MRTIAVINQKGGCGKTTTAINLAACLADHEQRVLLVDLDPQSHTTLGLGLNPGEFKLGIYDLLLDREQKNIRIEEVLLVISKYLHLLPSDVVLSAAEAVLLSRDDREYYLREILESVPERYDFIILDCPPSIGVLTFNALFACSEAIIPMDSGSFSHSGLSRLMETINLIRINSGHKIQVNVLATMFDRRTRIARESLAEIRRAMVGHVFQTVIHFTTALKEAAKQGRSIIDFSTSSTGYADYMNLTREVLAMVDADASAGNIQSASAPPVVTEDGVLFTYYAPQAKRVYLSADFTNWKTDKVPLFNIDGNGIWQKIVPLEPGRYEYKYYVDGHWKTDPANPNQISKEFGSNSFFEM
ncbi:MAG: AAA family ATPase [Deltaproteobacteria bacterium]|nr:AAA family ATPase [Deltaproteobacteria bacterium]